MNRISEGTKAYWAIAWQDVVETLGLVGTKPADPRTKTEVAKALGVKEREFTIEELRIHDVIGVCPELIVLTTEIDEDGFYLLFEEEPDDSATGGKFADEKITLKLRPNALNKRLAKEGITVELAELVNVYSDVEDGEQSPETIHLRSPEAIFKEDQLEPLLKKAGITKDPDQEWEERLDYEAVVRFAAWCRRNYGAVLLPTVSGYSDDEVEGKEVYTTALHLYKPTLEKETVFGPTATKVFAQGLIPFRLTRTQRMVG